MRTAIVVSCLLLVFCQLSVAQEVIVEAGANGGGSEGVSPPIPTITLEAPVAESQPQPQVGPQGPAGERGQDGAPGQNGRNGAPGRSGRGGRDGRTGRDGRPGKDTDLKEVSKLIQAGDAEVEKAAKTYTDQQVGNERDQRISADAKKKEAKKKVEHIGVWVVAALLGVIVGYLIWGRRPRQVVGPNEDYVGQLGAERDALGEPDPGSAVFGSLVRQRTSRYQRDECGRISAISRRVVEPAVGWVNAGTAPDTSAGGGGAALAIAVGSVSVKGEKEAGKPPFPPREEKKMPAGIPLEEVLADTKPGLPPTDAEKKEGTLTKLKRRVSRKKTPADAAAIADAKPTATEESKKEPAEAETKEV